MCTVCGCNEVHAAHEHHSHESHGQALHTHAPHHHHHHDYGAGAARVSVSGFTQERLIEIERDILSGNDRDAAQNRARLHDHRVLTLNLLSSPGAGKTTLLVETVKTLNGQIEVAVIEGDQETANDADRIRACGVEAVQINTGRGCHLDAHMVGHALEDIALTPGKVVFIENVGNLVCPAAFDLGETSKVVILSVTEGDDKPLKYPDMFAAADLMLISKIDLAPYVDFDADRALEYARRINPDLTELRLSARSGQGMAEWIDWVHQARRSVSPDGVPVQPANAVHA